MSAGLKALVEWYREEYARRTAFLDAGYVCIDWALPEYRVGWTEVVEKARALGIETNAVDLRLDFDRAIKAD